MSFPHSKPKIAISACVMGDEVRYNGGHKRHRWVTDELAPFVELQKFCPEFEIGLGVPRETIRLVDSQGDGVVQAVSHSGDNNVTEPMLALADQYAAQAPDWDAVIFMHKSPSCGMKDVKLYGPKGIPNETTSGLFAGRLRQHMPLLPMEEAGRLNDHQIREHFLTRVYVQHRWRIDNPAQSAKALLSFHSRSKYLIMAYSYPAYQALGKLLSDLTARPIAEIATDYYLGLCDALSKPASRGQITNVLQHIQGYLKDNLSSERRQSLRDTIDKYQAGRVPMIVPLTLLQHHLETVWDGDAYIRNQYFLNPYPEALGLRNTI